MKRLYNLGKYTEDNKMNNHNDDNNPFLANKTKDANKVHSINPLGLRIVVRIPKNSGVSDGGLFIPENAKDNTEESLVAEVISVASALDEETDEEANISGIPLGAWVLIEKKIGVKVPWDERLRIVETHDVLAIVKSYNLS